jgi:sarcosine oxidase subunit alpha
VTTKELAAGIAEGFSDPETLKRYSTVTMGPCQGKMCHGLLAAAQAELTGTSDTPRLTTARPPFQPVTLAALAGPHLAPVRRTAMHERHASLGARWVDMGDWKRPFAYGEVADEVRAVRQAAGIIDVSTLGKLELMGPDSGPFLDWLHPNRFSDLRVGRVRYRAMLDDAGIVLDDGTVARLGDERFFVSTTTGNVDAVDQWLRWWLAGSDRDVAVANVTSHYAAVNLAGPRARDILVRLTDVDVSREAFPYLTAREGTVAGVPAIVLRLGFVGEVGFEIHVPADHGAHLWDALMDAGRDAGLRPFGVEAQRVLRLEKLHPIVGQDTDALSDPAAAGMGWLVKSDKPDFIGRDALLRLDTAPGGDVPPGTDVDRPVLTGFAMEGTAIPAEGSAVVADGRPIGRVTSSKWSPTLGRPIGLAWVARGHAADGAPLTIRLGADTHGASAPAVVRTRPFYDPDGERQRG